MNSAPMPWIKLWTRLLSNSAFGRMPESAQLRYYKLLQLAGLCDAGGGFFENGHQMTEEEIAWTLHMDKDQLAQDLQTLKVNGFAFLNGRGWEINNFMDEQGPSSHADTRSRWVERQRVHRAKDKENVIAPSQATLPLVTGDTSVTQALKSQESESRVKSQESEEESIIPEKEPLSGTDGDVHEVLTKDQICQIAGIPLLYGPKGKTFHLRQRVLDANDIQREDIVAQLAWNYSRQGKEKGQVKQPAVVTGINLARGERAAAEWYDLEKWQQWLPPAMIVKLARFIQEQRMNPKQVIDNGYTHNEVKNKVAAFLGKNQDEPDEEQTE
jgi:hypothetical protein